MKRISKILASLTLIASPVFFVLPAYAVGSGSIYLSPASASVEDGKTITLNVIENSGSTVVNGAQVYLTYSSNFKYKSSSCVSNFTCAQNTYGGGKINIS